MHFTRRCYAPFHLRVSVYVSFGLYGSGADFVLSLQVVSTQYAEFYRSSREINASELKLNVFLQILFWTSDDWIGRNWNTLILSMFLMQYLHLGQKQQVSKTWSRRLKFYVPGWNPSVTLLWVWRLDGDRAHGIQLFTLTLSCSSAPENVVPTTNVSPPISLSLSGYCWRHLWRASLCMNSKFENSTLLKSQI